MQRCRLLQRTTCLPSSHAVLTVHRKNWDPLVLGPALAIDRMPPPVCFSCRGGTACCQSMPAGSMAATQSSITKALAANLTGKQRGHETQHCSCSKIGKGLHTYHQNGTVQFAV